ncbi:MAG: hypothetical protein M0Z30_05360 [Actinomycetota bacterium]|nr:hypothetical protein [Actinomycetota bacterium]
MEEGHTKSVLLGDARDPERCLRATWHPDSATVVFSFWNGPVCAASTPVDLADASRLVDLLVGALRQTAEGREPETMVMRLPRRSPVWTDLGAYESGE